MDNLTKKIIKFLFEFKDISIEKRGKFLRNLNTVKRKEIIDNLILVLDKYDHLKKATIQGRIFKAYIENKLSQEEYFDLTYATNLLNIEKVKHLVSFYKTEASLKAELIYNFSFLQLISIDNSKIGTWDGGGPDFCRNNLGTKYTDLIEDLAYR